MVRHATTVVFIGALLLSLPRVEAVAAWNRATLRCRGLLMADGGVERVLAPPHRSTVPVELGYCSRAFDQLARSYADGPTAAAIERWRIELALAGADFGPALALAQAGRAEHPGDSWYPLVLGLVHHARGEYPDAARVWLEADSTGSGLNAVADRLSTIGGAVIAAQYFQIVVAEQPRSADAHLRVAESLFRAGRSADALQQYQIGFAAGPSSSSLNLGEAAYHHARLLAEAQRYDEAIAAIQMAMTQHPAYSTYTAFLGRVYSLRGDYANAERWFDETLRLAPGNGTPFWEYGQYYVRRQMYRQALPWFRKAVDAQPGQAPSFFYGDLGGAYLALGSNDLAIHALEEAVRRDPGNPTYRMWLDDARSKRHN